jgi:urease gamma subunit
MPVVGTLYLFNEALCFYSQLSSQKLFDGSKTVIKIEYS